MYLEVHIMSTIKTFMRRSGRTNQVVRISMDVMGKETMVTSTVVAPPVVSDEKFDPKADKVSGIAIPAFLK